MKIIFTCIAIALLQFSFLVKAHAIQNSNNSARELKFNHDWRFRIGEGTGLASKDIDDSDWRLLNLPHDWTIEGEFNESNPSGAFGGFLPGGVGWYRKTFVLGDSVKNKKVFIRFDGIHMNSEVWINNNLLGRYPSGYSTIIYDLTEHIKPNEKNVIAVKVDNTLEPSVRYYGGAGIYRNSWLIITNKTHFDNKSGVFVSYKNVSEKSAVITCNYKIVSGAYEGSEFHWWRHNPELNTRITKRGQLTSVVLSNTGKILAEKSDSFLLGDYITANFNQEFTINNPVLWNAANPATCQLKSVLSYDGKIVDQVITRIGIRSIAYSTSKGMLVNGKQEKLKGVCLHQDAGSVGNAVPDGVWHYRLAKLKKMGANAIRTSHHPFAPEFYTMCDTMGFYIMDEAFDEWNVGYITDSENTGGKMKYGYHLYFNQWAETDLVSMIHRHRNHPSVVMYSIGNEIPNQLYADGAKWAGWLQSICHREDPTRLVTAGCDWIAFANLNGFLDTLDIAGYNYAGRYYAEKMYQPERELYPNRLFVGTETYYNDIYWRDARDNDYVIGEFLWAGFDYLGEGIAWPKRGWDACLIDMAGKERPEYYLRKCIWNPEPEICIGIKNADKPESNWHPLPLVSSWNWKWNAGYLLEVFVYSNCDEVEVFVNDTSYGKQTIDKNKYVAQFKIPFLYGNIKAVGYINGKEVKTYAINTASQATAFKTTGYKKQLLANAEDVSVIEIDAIDNNNNLVIDFNQEVFVEVIGEGKLIGLDCANQRSHEKYKKNSRMAYNGRLLATIQSTLKPGNIKIRISSKGMKDVEIQLQSKNDCFLVLCSNSFRPFTQPHFL